MEWGDSSMTKRLSHLDSSGRARMVDISAKGETLREAIACGKVLLDAPTIELIKNKALPKGGVVETARIAGILAAKRTAELIPLCHPIPITDVNIELSLAEDSVEIRSRVRTRARTGVEMEALTAVSVAALTVYDMVKAVCRSASITDIELVEKRGGKSGIWKRCKSAG